MTRRHASNRLLFCCLISLLSGCRVGAEPPQKTTLPTTAPAIPQPATKVPQPATAIPHSARRADFGLGVYASRVVFLGDGITYDGRYITDIAAYFVTRYPEMRFDELLNLGLPGETVSGLSEPDHEDGRQLRPDLHNRLSKVITRTSPRLVIACYGMNDGIYLPLDENRFDRFRDGMSWLHGTGQSSTRTIRIIHVSPSVFDEAAAGHPGYRYVMERYSQWLLDQRPSGWEVIDINSPMSIQLDRRRVTDPAFAFAPDGVHPDDNGHWLMARRILVYFGGEDVAKVRTVDEMLSVCPNGRQVYKLVSQQQEILRDAWLTEISPNQPGVKQGLPIEEAKTKAAELQEQIRALLRPETPTTAETRPAQ